jgi:hypothetical protein
MKHARLVLVALVAVVALGAAACSSDSDSDSKSSDSTTTTKAKSETTSTPGCKSTDDTSTQRMTVDPCDGLTDGQVVKVYGTKFTPDKTVGVTLCAAETNDAGDGCDLSAIKTGTVGADGSVTIDFPVKKVLASKAPVDCGTEVCVLSVGELVAADAERADAVEIKFAA